LNLSNQRFQRKRLFNSLAQKLNPVFLFTFCVLILTLSNGMAKPAGSISGTVKDAKTGEVIPGVNIIIKGTVLGTSTNLEGYFELKNIPPGDYNLQFTMMGYETHSLNDVNISADKNTALTIELVETVLESPELIVTASKRAQKIDDSPTSIAIIPAKSFEQRNQVYLDQLLEYVPGVNLMGEQVNIRGSSGFSYGIGSRVLLLVDGVPVMSSDTGEIKWDLISSSQIQRIEIVKSAGSALYGASALGGVINVITKEAALKPETNIRFSFGFYDDPPWAEWKWSDRLLYFNNTDVSHARKIGDHSVFFSVGRHQSEGYTQNGEYERYNASAKAFLKLSTQSNLTLSGNWEGGQEGIGVMWRNRFQALEVEPLAVGDEVHSNKLALNAIHQWAVNKNLGLRNRASYFRSFFENFMHDNDDYSTGHRIGYEFQGNYMLSKSQSLTFGIEETLDLISFYPVGDHDIFTSSAYFQDEIRVFPNLLLTLGFRYDYTTTNSDLTDDEFSPKFGLVWHLTDRTTLRLSSGKGFRAPSISERFPNIYAAGLKVIPNPELMPETAWSYEIGLSTPLSRQLFLDIAAFQNDYWDLIEPVPDITNTVQFINLTRARISGIETNVRFSVLNRLLTGSLGYTYLNPQDLDLNEVLGYRSKHMFKTSLSGNYRNLEVGVDYRYYDKIEKVKLYPQDPRVPQKVLDLRASFTWRQFVVTLNVNNFHNYMYTQYERTIMPLRNYCATLKYQF